MMRAHLSLTPRHPELVSGSIGRRTPERAYVAQPCGWVAYEPTAPRRAGEWTLKQVQGDEEGEVRMTHAALPITRHPGARAGVPLGSGAALKESGTPDQVRGDEGGSPD
jgi:hypothetical protein